MGCAKWVPRPTRSRDRLDDRGVGVAGERDAVPAVEVGVLVAVDVVELRAVAVADPDGVRLGDLPAGGGAAGEDVCARSDISRLRGWRSRNDSGLVVDQGVDPSGQLGAISVVVIRGSSPVARSLTDCSVYVSVRNSGKDPTVPNRLGGGCDGRRHGPARDRTAAQPAYLPARRPDCRRRGAALLQLSRVPRPALRLRRRCGSPRRRTRSAGRSASKYPIIESGLKPESGSVLRIYNYADYLSPG